MRPGELQPEVAHLLCCMSDPRPDDVFLDPFCGWGAIAAERLVSFPFRSITALDLDPGKVEHVKTRLGENPGSTVLVKKADAAILDGIPDGSLSTVVTDPPWGVYEPANVPSLYRKFLERVSSLLRPEGVVVLLLSREQTGWDAIAAAGFDITEQYDILLSGRKASAVRLRMGLVNPAAPGP